MDDYMDMDCDDYFDTHDIDDLMEWENEAVFQDSVLDRHEYECDDDTYEEENEDAYCGYDCYGRPIGG